MDLDFDAVGAVADLVLAQVGVLSTQAQCLVDLVGAAQAEECLGLVDGVGCLAFVQVQGIARIGEDMDEVRRIATETGGRYMGADRAEEFGARNGVPGELVVWIEPTKVIASLDATA